MNVSRLGRALQRALSPREGTLAVFRTKALRPWLGCVPVPRPGPPRSVLVPGAPCCLGCLVPIAQLGEGPALLVEQQRLIGQRRPWTRPRHSCIGLAPSGDTPPGRGRTLQRTPCLVIMAQESGERPAPRWDTPPGEAPPSKTSPTPRPPIYPLVWKRKHSEGSAPVL